MGPMVGVFLVGFGFAAAGLGYVWQRQQIYRLGQDIRQCELRLEGLRRQTKKLRSQLAFLSSQPQLDLRVKQLGLGLGPPQMTQILRLAEPVVAGVDEGAGAASPLRVARGP
jgi:hypothetical protein